MNDEKYVIGSGSFRLLIGDLYDLYCYHFSLTRRLAEAAERKGTFENPEKACPAMSAG